MKRAPACSRGVPALPPHPSPSARPTQPPSAPSHLQCSFPPFCSVLLLYFLSTPPCLLPHTLPSTVTTFFLSFGMGNRIHGSLRRDVLSLALSSMEVTGGDPRSLGDTRMTWVCISASFPSGEELANRDHQPSILPRSKALSPFKFR